jgi:hypothetical protein
MMDTCNTATTSSDGNNETEGSGSVQGSCDQTMSSTNPFASLGSTANAEEPAGEWADGEASDSGMAAVAKGSASASTVTTSDPTRFPCKLHRMLTEIEDDESLGLQNIVSWQPHGRCKYHRVSGASLVT